MPTELQLARCREESLLPDVGTLHARMLLGAWEVGLEDVSEDAAMLLCVAVEVRAGATGKAQPLVDVNMMYIDVEMVTSPNNNHFQWVVEGRCTLPAASVQAFTSYYACLNSSSLP